MARERVRVGSLSHQVEKTLGDRLRIGESKHAAKAVGAASNGIYSWETYRSYMKHCNYFAAYCKENYGCKTLSECREFANDWLQHQIDRNLSPYTLKLEVSALSKLYGVQSSDFIATPSRQRAKITRSRENVKRDKNFSTAKNERFVSFCRSTGLRRSELRALTGDKLELHNGSYYIRVDSGAKGGRERLAPVVGDVQNVVDLMNKAGNGKVFSSVFSNADIHGYRADYAAEVYQRHARNIKTIPRAEIYHCRGELKGVKYDKLAMLKTSAALGHNRISVVAGHYLR